MPKLSDTMTVGTVVKWHKQVGDEVSNGDILAEVETDKATMELENFDDGVLLQLLAEEGDEVEIGKPLIFNKYLIQCNTIINRISIVHNEGCIVSYRNYIKN